MQPPAESGTCQRPCGSDLSSATQCSARTSQEGAASRAPVGIVPFVIITITIKVIIVVIGMIIVIIEIITLVVLRILITIIIVVIIIRMIV